MNTRIFALAALCFIPSCANAAIYQCEVDGKTVFTDRPCSGTGQEIIIEEYRYQAPDVEPQDFGAINAAIGERMAARSTKREISRLETKVRKTDKAIDGYRAQMDRELSVWRPPGQHAAIRGYWDARVSDQEREIAGYHREIDKLNAKLGPLLAPQDN